MSREKQETFDVPEVEMEEVASIFRSYGLPETTVSSIAQAIRGDHRRWIEFMTKVELGLDKPDPARARTSALTIAGSYIVGGLVPLAPYFVLRSRGPRSSCPSGDSARVAGLRIREGHLHGQQTLPECLADDGRRRAGGRVGVYNLRG